MSEKPKLNAMKRLPVTGETKIKPKRHKFTKTFKNYNTLTNAKPFLLTFPFLPTEFHHCFVFVSMVENKTPIDKKNGHIFHRQVKWTHFAKLNCSETIKMCSIMSAPPSISLQIKLRDRLMWVQCKAFFFAFLRSLNRQIFVLTFENFSLSCFCW